MKLRKTTNAVILSHFLFKDAEKGAGIPHNIRDYLKDKINHVTYIDHPFPGSSYPYSQMTIYKKGKMISQSTFFKTDFSAPLLFPTQLLINVYFLIKSGLKYELCFACDNHSTLSCYAFRKLGKIKRLIYYSIDFTWDRYENKLLNILYHAADRMACNLSDINWVVTSRITDIKMKNKNSHKYSPFQVVHNGFKKSEIQIAPINKIKKYNLIWGGVLYEKQGVQLAIKSMSKLKTQFPKLHLTIIGTGPHESKLKTLTRKLKLQSKVTFTGYIDDHKKINEYLTHSSIGLAPYTQTEGNFSFFGAPSKIRLYLLCGLPVITTSVPSIAKTIKKGGAGIVINYDESEYINAVTKLLSNRRFYLSARKSALRLSSKYDIDKILSKAIEEI